MKKIIISMMILSNCVKNIKKLESNYKGKDSIYNLEENIAEDKNESKILMYAIENGNKEIIKLLIEKSKNIEKKDTESLESNFKNITLEDENKKTH